MKLSKEIKIGLISIIVFVIAIWGFNFLKGKNILNPTAEYITTFDRIDGLIESGYVYYKGYKIGNISSIFFDHENSGKFILKFVIEKDIEIPLGSSVAKKSSSLIASANDLEIKFSDSKQFHQFGDTLISESGSSLMDELDPIKEQVISVLTGIDTLLYSINSVLNDKTQDTLQQAFADLAVSLSHIKKELSPTGDLTQTLKNLEGFSENLASNNEKINTSLNNISNISSAIDSADLFTTITTLNENLSDLAVIMNKIESGEGNMGKLINDSSLYANLDSTVYHLDKLLVDIQENPKRYVQVSVFGKKDK